jgi:16S rRNA processing protein RimM
MEDYLEIGKIANTHGVKGELKIVPLTDDPKRFDNLKWIFADINGVLKKFSIESVKYFKNFVILKFEGINDLNSAEALKGILIKIDRENAIKLPKNSFFICDLIFCLVYDEAGKLLGELKDVLQTGSNDVYIVRNENNKEILIPALKSVVKKVSIKDKRIIVSLPEGLVDDEV